MTHPSAGTAHGRWTAQLLWILPPLAELPVVAVLCSALPEVGRDAAFGTPMSQLAALLALAVAGAGFVAAARGVGGPAQGLLAALLAVAAGVVAALGLGFLAGGAYPVLGVLLAHSALSIAMLARATLRADQ